MKREERIKRLERIARRNMKAEAEREKRKLARLQKQATRGTAIGSAMLSAFDLETLQSMRGRA